MWVNDEHEDENWKHLANNETHSIYKKKHKQPCLKSTIVVYVRNMLQCGARMSMKKQGTLETLSCNESQSFENGIQKHVCK